MSDWKEIVKHGWHPEKEGTSLKGQVKSLVGRGDKSSSHSSGSHSAAPISTLRDPSSFGPPPKRVGSTGAQSPASVSSPYQPPTGQTYGAQQPAEEPAAAPKPYSVDTTGLSTTHLPPPPVRRGSPDKRGPIPPPSSSAKPPGPPSLPPRLPPRSGNASPAQAQSPVSTGGSQPSGYLNQGAIDRLGAAGISVPGLGIGGKTPPPPPARSPTTTSSPSTGLLSPKPSNGQINELQSRFSRLGTTSSQQEPTTAPTQGTSWADKQAALKTASNFRKDPSSVSLADAKAAAGTAHNFHQRHGDQVAAGLKTANGLNQRFNGVEDNRQGMAASPTSPMGQITGIIGKKKPPPPPPTKKPQLSGTGNQGSGPPPVPLATRPKF
ncbi:hypothetical protein F5Y13DRAFT_151532 [Hypoxylon sp. FL1857]|nr:hypothetical protein F5Y13DRAFT_151532 [Hypoxylon sp. FL1857]